LIVCPGPPGLGTGLGDAEYGADQRSTGKFKAGSDSEEFRSFAVA